MAEIIRPLRPPHFAGRYYFPDAGRLRAAVESYIEDASVPRPSGTLIGLIVPHSQLSEFGVIAGYAYKLLLSAPLTWDETLLLAPTMHGDHLQCDPSAAYDTLLEPMPIDRNALTAIRASGITIDETTDDEPVIECHAPFVQMALGEMSVLPLRVPVSLGLDGASCSALAQRRSFIIACANLPADYEDRACDAITHLDAAFFDGNASNEKRGLFARKASKPTPSPDATTIALALALALAKAKGATHSYLLKRAGVFAAFAITQL